MGDKVIVNVGGDTQEAVNRDKYEELARSQVSDSTTRALPALAEGLFFVRDTKVLKCVDLRPGKQ